MKTVVLKIPQLVHGRMLPVGEPVIVPDTFAAEFERRGFLADSPAEKPAAEPRKPPPAPTVAPASSLKAKTPFNPKKAKP